MDTTQKNRPESPQQGSRPEKPQQAPRREAQGQRSRQEKQPAQRQKEETARKRAPNQRTSEDQSQRSRRQPAQQKASSGAAKAAAAKTRSQSAQKQRSQSAARRESRRQPPDDLSAKRRAYGNSKPKKKPLVTRMTESVSGAISRAKAKTKAKNTQKRKTNHPTQPAPAIIYTQPKAFNRTRLLVQLLSVAAVVAAMVMSLSVFFKVKHITVSGMQTYDAYAVEAASGIQKQTAEQKGDNLFSFSHARAGAQIVAKLPYVKSVRFGIKLPDTVNIIIEEEDVVYAIKDNTGTWWLMNASGRVVTMANNSKASNYTQILGVTLDYPAPNTQAMATEVATAQTDASGAAVPLSVTGAQRLDVAKQILTAMESNGIVGEAASVDVSRTEDIILWYGSRYQVNLGDASQLEYKIACMKDAILQLGDYETGILDISFTIWPDKVMYTPFG